MFSIDEIKSLNELEMEVYRYVMEHKITIPYMRIRELATEAHVSTTTIMRFCKKMGCDGYAEFRYQMKGYIGQDNNTRLEDHYEEIQRFFHERLHTPHFQQQLERATTKLATAERILFFGIGNSGCAAEYASRYFTNVGKFSLSISDPFYPARHLYHISTLAVLISVSGESEEVLQFAADMKKKECPIISITSSNQSTLARLSDISLCHGVQTQRYDSLDFTSQVPTIYLLETLGRNVQNRLLETHS